MISQYSPELLPFDSIASHLAGIFIGGGLTNRISLLFLSAPCKVCLDILDQSNDGLKSISRRRICPH